MLITYLKQKLRPMIFPVQEMRDAVRHSDFERVLDVGCGKCIMYGILKTIKSEFKYTGIELDGPDIENTEDFRVITPDALEQDALFDLIVFSDVLHHIPDKKPFLDGYLAHCAPGGCVLVKDMSPESSLCRAWNRMHDRLLSGDTISEISSGDLIAMVGDGYEASNIGKRRIFLYDHYWILFTSKQKKAQVS